MASSSLSNFLSLFTPSKPPTPPPKAPPPNISLSTHSPSSSSSSSSPSSSRNRDGLVPLVMSNEAHQYHYNPVSSSSADLMTVVCPSLAYANTLFFRSAYNVQVIVDDNEPEEKLLNRFRREVMRAGVIQECKRRRFFENKQEEKKRKTREAAKRNKRRRTPFRPQIQDKQEGSKKREEVDDDNWELPEGNLPS